MYSLRKKSVQNDTKKKFQYAICKMYYFYSLGSGSITIPVLCMLISGETTKLEVQYRRSVSHLEKQLNCWFGLQKEAFFFSLFIFCQRVDLSLKNSIPWLVLAGSGGVADFLTEILENQSSASAAQPSSEGDGEAGPSVDLKDRMTECVKKFFPTEVEMDKLVERVGSVSPRGFWQKVYI